HSKNLVEKLYPADSGTSVRNNYLELIVMKHWNRGANHLAPILTGFCFFEAQGVPQAKSFGVLIYINWVRQLVRPKFKRKVFGCLLPRLWASFAADMFLFAVGDCDGGLLVVGKESEHAIAGPYE